MFSESVILALFGPIGTPELIIIAALGLLIFGRKLPEVGRSVGKAIVEFKRGLTEVKDEVKDATKDLPAADEPAPSPPVDQSNPATGANQADHPTSPSS